MPGNWLFLQDFLQVESGDRIKTTVGSHGDLEFFWREVKWPAGQHRSGRVRTGSFVDRPPLISYRNQYALVDQRGLRAGE